MESDPDHEPAHDDHEPTHDDHGAAHDDHGHHDLPDDAFLAGLDREALARRLRLAGLVVLGLAVVAMVVLWPRGEAPDMGVIPVRYVDATVIDVETGLQCAGIETIGEVGCREIAVRVTSGPDAPMSAFFTVVETDLTVPHLAAGDRIVLRDAHDAPEDYRFGYHDHQRKLPLVLLAVGFAVSVVALGRWKGARALVGLALGVGVILLFMVPALLRDGPPLAVAIAAGVVVVGVALYLAHGVSAATSIALLGAVSSLLLVTVLAAVVLSAAHVTGLSGAEAQALSVTADALDLRGLLVAGIVVGVLGSLDDVTVAQVSTVAALRRTAPGLGPLALYREAMRVGRDHVASSVNTLVLAYAGASLPLMLLFAQGGQPVGRVITDEVVAIEVVRMLVGCIGLVAAVPVTTALAALVMGGAGSSEGEAAPVVGWDDLDDVLGDRRDRWW